MKITLMKFWSYYFLITPGFLIVKKTEKPRLDECNSSATSSCYCYTVLFFITCCIYSYSFFVCVYLCCVSRSTLKPLIYFRWGRIFLCDLLIFPLSMLMFHFPHPSLMFAYFARRPVYNVLVLGYFRIICIL